MYIQTWHLVLHVVSQVNVNETKHHWLLHAFECFELNASMNETTKETTIYIVSHFGGLIILVSTFVVRRRAKYYNIQNSAFVNMEESKMCFK